MRLLQLLHPQTIADARAVASGCEAKLVVYTSLDTTGPHDASLMPPPLPASCTLFFIGERVEHQGRSGWSYVWHRRTHETSHLSSRRFSKIPKLLPHVMLPEYTTIFMDSKLRLRASAPADLQAMLGSRDFMAFQHPCVASYAAVGIAALPLAWQELCKTCKASPCSAFDWLRQEAALVGLSRKVDSHTTLQSQVSRYAADHLVPPAAYRDVYLEGALIVQRNSTRVMSAWSSEFFAAGSSDRDQLSFAYSMARTQQIVHLITCGDLDTSWANDLLACPWGGFPFAIADEVPNDFVQTGHPNTTIGIVSSLKVITTRQSVYSLHGTGCCRHSEGSLPAWTFKTPTLMTTSECAAACDERRPRCTGFEMNAHCGQCSVPLTRQCTGCCWLHGLGQQLALACDRETGKMICYLRPATPGWLETGPEHAISVSPRRSKRQATARNQAPHRDIAVVLTATIAPLLHLPGVLNHSQQRNPIERASLYRKSVERWAWGSNLPIIFVENSGQAGASLLRDVMLGVPDWRRRTFEFLSYEEQNATDIGQSEARAVLYALDRSSLLRARRPSDMIVKVTGRYFVHDLEGTVDRACWGVRTTATKRVTWLMVQQSRPAWRAHLPRELRGDRSETRRLNRNPHAWRVLRYGPCPLLA